MQLSIPHGRIRWAGLAARGRKRPQARGASVPREQIYKATRRVRWPRRASAGAGEKSVADRVYGVCDTRIIVWEKHAIPEPFTEKLSRVI